MPTESQTSLAENKVRGTYDGALEEWCRQNSFTKVTHTIDDIDDRYKSHPPYDDDWQHHNYIAIAFRNLSIRSSYYRAGLVGNHVKGAEASSKEIIERILNTNVLDRYVVYGAKKDTWVNSMYGILRSFGLSPPPLRAKL